MSDTTAIERDIVRVVACSDPIVHAADGSRYCFFCVWSDDGNPRAPIVHVDCPWELARRAERHQHSPTADPSSQHV